MKSDKRRVLALRLGNNRYHQMSHEDLDRYATYMGLKPPYNRLSVARRLIDPSEYNHHGPVASLVRYFDTEQYSRAAKEGVSV